MNQDEPASIVQNDLALAEIRRRTQAMEAAGLSTDGPTPAIQDLDVLKNGEVIFVTHSITPGAMEAWVAQVRQQSGQRVDWQMWAGRRVVKALGDIEAVRQAVKDLMEEHDRLRAAAVKRGT